MTKQELDQAYFDGRLNAENYKLAIAKLGEPQAPQVQQQQQPVIDPAMEQLKSAQTKNPISDQYDVLMKQYQQTNVNMPKEQIESQLVLPALEKMKEKQEEDKKAALDQQKREAELKEQNDLRKKQLGLVEEPRKPAQDGEKPLDLLDNPAAQPTQQKQPETVQDKATQMGMPSLDMGGSNLGQVQAAYSDVQKAEKEFSSLIAEQKLQDQRRQQSAYEAEQFYKGKLQEAESYNKQFENASQIDPSRYWANADTWSKVGAILASAFSGYAQAYTGGRNVGLDMIKDMIDKDVDAQVKNANLLQQKAQSAMNMFQTYRQIFKDDQLAYDATKMSALNLVKAKYEMAQGKFKNAADMAKLDTELKELSVKMQNKVLENGTALTQALDYKNNPKARFDNELNKDPARLAQMIKDKKVEVIDINGNPFVTENTQVAKDLRNNYSAYKLMTNNLDKIAEIQQGGFTDQEKRDRFKMLKANLVSYVKQQKQLGTLDNGLLNFADSLFSGIQYTNVLGDAQKAINSYKKDLTDEFETFANSTFSGKNTYVSEQGTNPELKTLGKKLQ